MKKVQVLLKNERNPCSIEQVKNIIDKDLKNIYKLGPRKFLEKTSFCLRPERLELDNGETEKVFDQKL